MYLVSVLELMYLYIYKLLICVDLFLVMALLHYICIDDVVSLINVRCKYNKIDMCKDFSMPVSMTYAPLCCCSSVLSVIFE